MCHQCHLAPLEASPLLVSGATSGRQVPCFSMWALNREGFLSAVGSSTRKPSSCWFWPSLSAHPQPAGHDRVSEALPKRYLLFLQLSSLAAPPKALKLYLSRHPGMLLVCVCMCACALVRARACPELPSDIKGEILKKPIISLLPNKSTNNLVIW